MEPGVEVLGVSKRFGATQALDGVDLRAFPGEVHVVLGENGAGKTTLMNLLSGALQPDRGSVRLPAGAVGMVHQHFMLVPAFTVAENLALAAPAQRGWSPARAAEPALAIARELGWPLDPGAICADLPVGARQRLEILKALAGGAPVLVFDEPTATLAPAEVDELFRILRRLRDAGRTILVIAHKLSEALAIGDRFTVLRKGRVVASVPRAEADAARLAEWMVGQMPAASSGTAPGSGAAVVVRELTVRGDSGAVAVERASFEIGPGEILGIGGVDGNGQLELAEALAGIRPSQGSIETPAGEAAYLPQDRHRDGLALRMSVLDNLLIAGHRRPGNRRGPLLSLSACRAWAARLAAAYDIRFGSLDDPVGTLSGGNQQKVVVGRTLEGQPGFVVAGQPTRGLDVAATAEVHSRLRGAAASGVPVLLFSTDLDELAALAHRTLFLSRGRLSEQWTAESYLGGGE